MRLALPHPTRRLPRGRPLAALAAAAALLAGLAGCADSGGSGGSDGTDPAGSEFWSTQVTRDRAVVDLVPGTRIILNFGESDLGASAGCNSMGGAYTLANSTLQVADMFSTEMGCDPARHDQDRFVADFLMAGPTLTLDGDHLSLATADTTIEFADSSVANPDQALIGPRWVVTGFIAGDVAMNMAAQGDPGWVQFANESNMAGFDSCIHLDAHVEIGDQGGAGELQFGEITSPDAAVTSCMVSDYMTAFNTMFATGSATWHVDGQNLTILATDGNGVTFSAE